MKISTKARYAVSALADLARLTEQTTKKAIPLCDIAEHQELPIPYLEQIFLKLRRANLVQSVRGAHGGYSLARLPSMIRVADIIYAVDIRVKATRCNEHSPSGCLSTGNRCLTHDLWEGLGSVIHQYFSQITLHDIVQRNLPSLKAPLLQVTEEVRHVS